MNCKRITILVVLSAVIIITFLYGYAFLYDYFYSKNFPQIPVTAYAAKFDPTKFSDQAISFVVELANSLKEAIS